MLRCCNIFFDRFHKATFLNGSKFVITSHVQVNGPLIGQSAPDKLIFSSQSCKENLEHPYIVDKVFSLRTALFHRAIKAHLFETLAKDLTPCKLDSCSEIYSFDQISIRHFT